MEGRASYYLLVTSKAAKTAIFSLLAFLSLASSLLLTTLLRRNRSHQACPPRERSSNPSLSNLLPRAFYLFLSSNLGHLWQIRRYLQTKVDEAVNEVVNV